MANINWEQYFQNTKEFNKVVPETINTLNKLFYAGWIIENRILVLICAIALTIVSILTYKLYKRKSNKYKTWISLTINMYVLFIFTSETLYKIIVTVLSFNSKDIAFFEIATIYSILIIATAFNVSISIYELVVPSRLKLNDMAKQLINKPLK